MIKVGITGGIGSGKSTVCKIFEIIGIPIYYADDQAKKLMTGNKKLKTKIKALLGEESYYRNGRLNRQIIAKKVFNDNNLLAKLNELVHPAVGRDYLIWCTENQDSAYTIKEAALLIESGSYKLLDQLIVVTAPEDIRIQRVIKRDKSSKDIVKARIKNQMPEFEKAKLADFLIENSGNQTLITQVLSIHTSLLKLI